MAGPLEGVRILDLTRALAGPYGSMILGDLGAEIIKVELPGSVWDALGVYVPMGLGHQFLGIQRNKKSITINLKTEKGKAIFYELVKQADVVFDNYRPDVPKRLGVDYETLSQINPRIICCSLTGFGSTGPYRNRPAYDLIAQAIGGGMSITGEPGGPPCRSGMPIGDKGGGLFAVIAILAALQARERTGIGQRVESSLMEAQISLMGYVAGQYLTGGGVPGGDGSKHRAAYPYGEYETKDGRYIAIAAMTKFLEFCRVLELEHLAEDPRFSTPVLIYQNQNDLEPIFQEAFLTRGLDDWMERLVAHDIPCSPVYRIDESLSDPQVLDRDMVVSVKLGDGTEAKMVGNAIKMTGTPCNTYTSPMNVGENTEEVLAEFLGYNREKIQRLREEKVV